MKSVEGSGLQAPGWSREGGVGGNGRHVRGLGAARTRGGHGAGAPAGPDPGRLPDRRRGFTLIELIVVIAIIGILATIAVPAMRTYPMRAKESALKEDLFTIRSCIDQFHADRARFPSSLEEMVSAGYMRSMPRDPITGSTESWVPIYAEASQDQDEREQEAGAGQGIIDVKSGAEGVALDGTHYSDW